MTITATEVAGLDSTSNSSSYTSGAGSPSADRTLYAILEISDGGGADPDITDANVSGWSLSWTRVASYLYDDISVTHRLFIFTATTGGSAPGSGSFATGTLPNGAATGCQMSIVEVDGDDIGGEPYETTNVQDDPPSPNTSASVQSVTMNAFGAATHKYLVVFGLDGNTTLTPDDTVTTLHDNVIATPAQRLTVLLGPEGDNTPSSTTGSATIWGGLALELRAAAAGAQTVSPNAVTVPIAVNNPEVDQQVVPASIGIGVSVTEPAQVTQEVAPAAVSVPVALGTPEIDQQVQMDAVSIPITANAPIIQESGAAQQVAPGAVSLPITVETPSVTQEVTPAEIAVPLAVNAPEIDQQVRMNEVAVPVAVNAPSVNQEVVAAEIAVPLAVNAPTQITQEVTPDEVSIPVTLPAPTIEGGEPQDEALTSKLFRMRRTRRKPS